MNFDGILWLCAAGGAFCNAFLHLGRRVWGWRIPQVGLYFTGVLAACVLPLWAFGAVVEGQPMPKDLDWHWWPLQATLRTFGLSGVFVGALYAVPAFRTWDARRTADKAQRLLDEQRKLAEEANGERWQ